MTLRIDAGGVSCEDEEGPTLRVDQPLTPLSARMLRLALDIAGDPTGNRTFRVDLGEGTAVVYMEPHGGPRVRDGEFVMVPTTVDLIRREVVA